MGPNKWFLTSGAFESLIKSSACLPQITSGVPLPLLLSLSHTHSHKDTHIPKVYFPRGNFIRTLPATLRNWLLPSCADAESKIHCNQFSPFLSSDHSDAKEKATLVFIHFVLRWEPLGLVLSLWLPHLYRRYEANLTHADGVCRSSRC